MGNLWLDSELNKMIKVPIGVRRNAEKGLKLRKEYGRGGTEVGIRMAKFLAREEWISFVYVKKISEYFPRHQYDLIDEVNPPSNGRIAWLLWGGDQGWRWSARVVDKMRKELK